MTLNLRMVLQADSAAAKAALDDTARGVKGVTTATEQQTRASRTSTTTTDANTAAKQRNRQATDAMGRSHQMAAGATGNLVAQFNDIGMMLAAGQNPLQLAIQQGTQITQVIGPMGAAGAASALKAAFIGMLSPINLITVGLLAAGTAAIEWLVSATENAVTLEQQIEAVNDAIERWRDESGRSLEDLRQKFGLLTPEIVAMQRELTQLRISEILAEADAAAKQLAGTMGEGWLSTAGGDIRRLFDIRGLGSGRELVAEFKAMFTAIEEASGVGEQLQAVEQLRTRFAELTGGIQNMSAEQRAFYTSILDTEAALRAAAVATGDVATETDFAAAAATELASRANAVVSAIASADGSRLVAAFQSAFPVASQLLGMAQGIIDTIGAARTAAAAQDQLDQMAIEFSPGGQAMLRYGGRTPGGTASQNALGTRNRPAAIGAAGGGGGGGAAAARDEADALQELIDSLEGEIEALRVQDPIQKEMLKHREALAGATEEERAKVEELIAIREREMQQLTAAQELQAFKEDLVENALDGLIAKGQSLKEVLDQVIIALMKAVIQAAIFGSGPLGSMFGGKGLGALIFGAKAEGGMVYGPGTGTSDSIPTMLSNGEYVVNARATARNRNLLEAINSGGRVPGYAEGGFVGSDQRRMGGRGAMGGDVRISIDLSGARGDREIEAMARKGTQAALREYDREALPSSVKRVSSDPRRTG